MAQNEWDKGANNPILELGKDGTWDYMGVSNPSVIFDGTTYKMWYTGFDGNMRIGYATSTDGANWTKCQGYILDIGKPGEWDSQHVANPSVIFDAGIYKMWYTGCDKKMQIGYATSNDGVHWEKYLQNPVIDIGAWSTCPDGDIWSPTVVFGGTEYRMWYTSFDDHMRIGYATSTDGIHWAKYVSCPVLDTGAWGSWDDRGVWSPCVVFSGTEYRMWYSGWNGESVRIGYAISSDGISWTKNSSVPALETGTSGTWDYHYVSNPCVIYDGTNYKMWYSGCTYDEKYRIGYATGAIRTDISLSEYSHSFDEIAIGSYADWSFSISNKGSADLTISSIASDNQSFTISPVQLPQTIKPNESISIAIRFSRSEEKSYDGNITIVCNDRDEPELRIPVWMGVKLKYVRQIPREFVSFKKDIHSGMSGNDTRYLQVMLIEEGPDVYPESKVSGIFDGDTKKAVIEFQKKHRIIEAESGFVGSETRKKLDELLDLYRKETYDRVSTVYDTVMGSYKQYLPSDFPIEIIFALASQETGIYYNFNNELLEAKKNGHKDNTGRGIMQITTSDFVGAGSDISDDNTLKCRYLSDREACYSYYSNTLQGVESNIKDALYALKVKYDMASNSKGSKELGISDKEMRWISTVQRYNTYVKALFSVESEALLQNELNKCNIPESLKNEFKNCAETGGLSSWAVALVENKGNRWKIIDDPCIYRITDDGSFINVCRVGAPTVYIRNVADKLRDLRNPMLFPMLIPLLSKNRHVSLADKFEKVYNNSLTVTLGSPADIRVYDSRGQVTGTQPFLQKKVGSLEAMYENKTGMSGKEEIPNSIYDRDGKTIILMLPSDTYHYEVTGTAEGTYNLDITYIKDGKPVLFNAINIPTSSGEIHRYQIDWEALSQDKSGVNVQIGSDGIYKTIKAGKRFSYKGDQMLF